jgi:molybdopterin converting factor small subunit
VSTGQVTVHVPSPLFEYTGDRATFRVEGGSLDAVTRSLDERFPGLRFRIVDEQGEIRRHIRFYVNGGEASRLDARVRAGDEVHIVAALSGG